MRHPSRPLAALARGVAARALCAAAATAGCGGPNFQFDPAPAPPWTQSSGGPKGGNLEGIGAVPVTTQVQRDLELATADAKAKIAQNITTQVTARSSDWAISVQAGGETRDAQTTQQNIELRSAVTVEGATVAGQYRDEASHTQYVRVAVEQAAWAASVARRLDTGLAEIDAHLAEAERAIGANRPIAALGELFAATRAGATAEPDVVVIDLLNAALGMGKRLAEAKGKREALRAKIGGAGAAVMIKGGGDAAAELQRALGEFVASFGLPVAAGGKVRIEAEIGVQALGTEKVGNRTEHIFGAAGTLKVRDADGSEVASLGVSLPERAYTERDADAAAAKARALRLAADSLVSKFRSAFRSANSAE